MAAKSVDGVLKWALEQKALWQRSIDLLQKGKMGTSGIRHGRIVDTTADTLAEQIERLANLNMFIERHKTRMKKAR
jgi:hypothetical protein